VKNKKKLKSRKSEKQEKIKIKKNEKQENKNQFPKISLS